METKITSKYQTTIPQKVRDFLGVKKGEEVEWNIIRGVVMVGTSKKVKNPVKILTSQVRLDMDAVELVHRAREEFE